MTSVTSGADADGEGGAVSGQTTNWPVDQAGAPAGAPGVAQAVESAGRDPRDETLVDHRPWGQFEQFTLNEPTTVKIISVAAGQRLSLQRHALRDELWVILDVPLTVEIDGRTWAAQPGEKVWIPRTTTHRVGATAATGGRFLEVAFGHFEESDIERLADDYER